MWTLPKSADLAPRRGTHDARIGGGRDDSGAAAVEFALVVPLLLAFVLGVINYGFIFTAQISMNAGARDAGRAGVVKGPAAMQCRDIAERAMASVVAFGSAASPPIVQVIKPDSSTPLCSKVGSASPTSTVAGGTTATPCTASTANGKLTVRITYSYQSLMPLIPPSTMDLEANGIFRCEYRT